MKLIGLLCVLLVVAGCPPGMCAADLPEESWGLPDQEYYDYDDSSPPVDEDDGSLTGLADMATPEFNILPQVFHPIVGETVNLPCTSEKDESEVLIIKRHSFGRHPDQTLILAGEVFLINPKDKRYSMKDKVFTIQNVTRRDSSYYICLYQFNGMHINVTHTLDVYYPPAIRPRQRTTNVVKGNTVTLECKAGGNPKPTMKWKRSDGKEMPAYQPGNTTQSIVFPNVDRLTGGSYACTAENGIGTPAVANRDVIVTYTPEITAENQMVRTGTGDRVELVCVVYAHPAAEIQWSHNDVRVDADTRAEFVDGGHRHLLTIESVEEKDFGQYSCKATNQLGSEEQHIYVTDTPSKPNITSEVNSGQERSYTLTWTTDSFYPITYYEVMYRRTKANDSTDEPGDWVTLKNEAVDEETQEGNKHTFWETLSDLDRATDYQGFIKLRNTAKFADKATFVFSTKNAPEGRHQASAAGRLGAAAAAVLLASLISAAALAC